MDEIKEIQERNKKVELDKAWETSLTRRTLIAIVTYFVAVLFMYRIGVTEPFLNAFVPAGGYVLSTLTLRFFKRRWVSQRIT